MTVQVITQNTGANIRATYDEAYTGEADTRINANAATTNYSGDTAGFPLQAAYFGASDEQNSLFRFDISNVPSGATINSATLSVMSENVGWGAGNIACYRILRDVVIAEATWNIYSTGNSWGTGGGLGSGTDRSSSAEDTNTSVATTTGTEEFWDVTTGVSAAVGEAAAYVVLQLWYTGTTAFTGHGFSNDADTDGVRAELIIDYTESSGSILPLLNAYYS